MSIVNFSIPQNLNEKIQQVIKDQGFSSKAEFFRFSAIYFMQNLQTKKQSDEYEQAISDLSQALREKNKNESLPSIEAQFEDH